MSIEMGHQENNFPKGINRGSVNGLTDNRLYRICFLLTLMPDGQNRFKPKFLTVSEFFLSGMKN